VSSAGDIDRSVSFGLLAARKPANEVARGDLEALYSELAELLAIGDPDAIVRRAVELARDIVRLVRVSIYLRTESKHFMTGTWASDSEGAISDEHHVMYATNEIDATFIPDEKGAQYSVFDVETRGWVTCTPIRCGPAVIGVMFNDAGPSRAAFDEAKQAHAAILCSMLGTALGSLARAAKVRTATRARFPAHHLVMATVAMLVRDPGIGLDQIAGQLGVGLRRLSWIFKTTLGVSLPDYRNRLRLDRVAFLVAKENISVADAAIAAGFASHAQFQIVSKTLRWTGILQLLAGSLDLRRVR
jgi:AraC-like DNA-binding protein